MQLTSFFFALSVFALSGFALVSAAPQSFAARNALSPEDTLYVTFWENGCGPAENGNSATDYINNSDGNARPGDCVLNLHYGWQSVEIRQPSDGTLYSIDLFSGEGCNNPIIVSLDH
jgi:hypothetical protein